MKRGAAGASDAAGAVTRPPALPRQPSGPSSGWFAPLFAPMLRERRLAAAVAALGAAQLVVALLKFPGFPCPMLHATGVPCPACGASRACAAMLRGDAPAWFRMHAMAPVFVVAFALFVAAAVLPKRPRDRLAGWIDRVERRTALVKLVVAALIVYWLARLAHSPRAFSLLMRAGVE